MMIKLVNVYNMCEFKFLKVKNNGVGIFYFKEKN